MITIEKKENEAEESHQEGAASSADSHVWLQTLLNSFSRCFPSFGSSRGFSK